jgi:hypothetical protein
MTNIERINKLEGLRFMLAMKDRWDSKDYEQDLAWQEEIRALKEQG